MTDFAFFKIPEAGEPTLSIVDAASAQDAKRQARAAIDQEGLSAVRLWDGRRMVEVHSPPRDAPARKRSAVDDRGRRMIAMKEQGQSERAISEEFGIGRERVRQVLARTEARERMREQQPNRAALSVRTQNVLPLLIHEPEEDAAERDRHLPERVAALTRIDVLRAPNAGNRTVAEIEAWLWERGLCLSS